MLLTAARYSNLEWSKVDAQRQQSIRSSITSTGESSREMAKDRRSALLKIAPRLLRLGAARKCTTLVPSGTHLLQVLQEAQFYIVRRSKSLVRPEPGLQPRPGLLDREPGPRVTLTSLASSCIVMGDARRVAHCKSRARAPLRL